MSADMNGIAMDWSGAWGLTEAGHEYLRGFVGGRPRRAHGNVVGRTREEMAEVTRAAAEAKTARRQHLIENIDELLGDRVPVQVIASRLGKTVHALEAATRRAGRKDLSVLFGRVRYAERKQAA